MPDDKFPLNPDTPSVFKACDDPAGRNSSFLQKIGMQDLDKVESDLLGAVGLFAKDYLAKQIRYFDQLLENLKESYPQLVSGDKFSHIVARTSRGPSPSVDMTVWQLTLQGLSPSAANIEKARLAVEPKLKVCTPVFNLTNASHDIVLGLTGDVRSMVELDIYEFKYTLS